MDRHFKVIFEALLSVLIIIELLFLVLTSIGFIAGIKSGSVYAFGNWDVLIGILILIDFVFFRLIKGKNQNFWDFIGENWVYIIASIPLFFICFNLFHLLDFKLFIGLIGIIRIYALLKVLKSPLVRFVNIPQKLNWIMLHLPCF